MPVTIDQSSFPLDVDIATKRYSYNYPHNLNLRPGTDTHDKLRGKLIAMANDAQRASMVHHSNWQKIDRKLRAYTLPEYKSKRKTGDNTYTIDEFDVFPDIIMPATYATLETILSYMVAAFLGPPIFKYAGSGPEDVVGGMLLQSLINQQTTRGGIQLALHTMFRDAFAYGVGPVHIRWHRKFGVQTVVKEPNPVAQLFGITTPRRIKERKLIYEGNIVENIDPYNFLPDPNVAVHNIQDAEYVGWVETSRYTSLRSREADPEDFLFNVQYLNHVRNRSQFMFSSDNGSTRQGSQVSIDRRVGSNNAVDVVWMYVDLIPKDWELGSGKFPEKWVFGLANDQVIIAAERLDLDHNEFPIAVAAPDYDGYSAFALSRLMVNHDVQRLIDFLYNSHVQNIRKIVNDRYVVDPGIVNWYDVVNPKPGQPIRVIRSMWGRGLLNEGIQQLAVQDVTAENVGEAQLLMNLMYNDFSGAQDSMRGVTVNKGPRISAEAARGARQGAFSRMEKAAVLIDFQAMRPIARQCAFNTIQFIEEATYARINREFENRLRQDFKVPIEEGRVLVSPFDLAINFDVESHSGGIPGSEDVSTWVQLYEMVIQNPILAQEIDHVQLFKHISRQLGAKEVDLFIKSPTVMPDQQVEAQVAAGNLAPIDNPGGDGFAG